MSEENMVEAIQKALADRGVEEQVIAAGQFNPRGHTGGLFVGGLGGNEAGGALGRVGGDTRTSPHRRWNRSSWPRIQRRSPIVCPPA